MIKKKCQNLLEKQKPYYQFFKTFNFTRDVIKLIETQKLTAGHAKF